MYEHPLRMKKSVGTAVFLLPVFLWGVAAFAADPVDKANAAYEAGDYGKALSLAQSLALKDNTTAQVLLGTLYEKGQGAVQNHDEAMAWFRKAAVRGNSAGWYRLADMYQNGRGTEADGGKALKLCLKSAEQGYAPAQTMMGLFYSRGTNVGRDYAEAVMWFEKAAAQGEVEAQYVLGIMYHSGVGLPKQPSLAAQWLGLAAEQGHARAQLLIGMMSVEGYQGVERDPVEAHQWFFLSASQGNAEARKKLENLEKAMTPGQIASAVERERAKGKEIAAARRREGSQALPSPRQRPSLIGTKEKRPAITAANDAFGIGRFKEAYVLALPLAEKGDKEAQYLVGILFDRGYGVPKDVRKSLEWMRKAAEKGHVQAQFSLGHSYDKGQLPVAKDPIEAYLWYSLAASHGDEIALDRLQELVKGMMPEQVGEAKDRLQKWQGKHPKKNSASDKTP